MSQNVYEQMAGDKKTLADKLGTNSELGNVILALLGRLVIESNLRSKPIEGIEMAPFLNSRLGNGDLIMRSKVTFNALAIARPAMWQLTSDFARYAQSKAMGMAMALQRNPKLADIFTGIVEAIEAWAQDRGLRFEDVKVKQAIISRPGDVFVLKVGKVLVD
jgi:hypothetical protein